MTTYFKFVDCKTSWRNYFKLHEHLDVSSILSQLCNKTLAELFRLIFFLNDEKYYNEFDFYRLVQRQIQLVANNRKFDFFALDPVEVTDGRIVLVEFSNAFQYSRKLKENV